MDYWVDLDEFDMVKIERFARSIEKDCQEGVKWERRKLEWIREERAKEADAALGKRADGSLVDPTRK
jgi:hypothetical protein